MKSIIRAIDAGRANTKYVLADDDEEIKCAHFPSEAYAVERERKGDGLGSRRKTVCIPMDGIFYEVGPDVHLAADIFNPKVLQHDGYFETPEYLALVRGALHFMKEDEIDLLVVGLPVATFRVPSRVMALEKRMLGEHPLGKGRTVTVKRVKVLAQPTGALMYYGKAQNKLAELRKEKNLIIDPGARTFDWIVTQGMQQVESKSNSVNRGMFDVLQKIADGISDTTGVQYRHYEAIDTALRGGKNPIVFQKEYDITPHLSVARKVAQNAVLEMLHFVGDGSDIKNIIVVGGGAFFFRKAIKDAFPKHKILELKDALYANVKGFQLAGRMLHAQELSSRPPMPDSRTHAQSGSMQQQPAMTSGAASVSNTECNLLSVVAVPAREGEPNHE